MLNSDSVTSLIQGFKKGNETNGCHVLLLKVPTQLFHIEYNDERNNSHQ